MSQQPWHRYKALRILGKLPLPPIDPNFEHGNISTPTTTQPPPHLLPKPIPCSKKVFQASFKNWLSLCVYAKCAWLARLMDAASPSKTLIDW